MKSRKEVKTYEVEIDYRASTQIPIQATSERQAKKKAKDELGMWVDDAITKVDGITVVGVHDESN